MWPFKNFSRVFESCELKREKVKSIMPTPQFTQNLNVDPPPALKNLQPKLDIFYRYD